MNQQECKAITKMAAIVCLANSDSLIILSMINPGQSMLFTGDAEQRFDCRTCAEKRENQSQPGFRIKQTIQILPKQDSN